MPKPKPQPKDTKSRTTTTTTNPKSSNKGLTIIDTLDAKYAKAPKLWHDEYPEISALKGVQSAKCSGIFTSKEGPMRSALEELRAGTDWAAVVEKYSEEKKKNGGALGVISKVGNMAEFTDVALWLPVSQGGNMWIGTAKSKEGYHIIKVDAR
ncbi:hypothetical protein EJ05DRAFT_476274 [Pseudovirgaria hyperparasitica]|uniref:Peptidyl-prolyl cis-trans isomerase n=1 Tax=Pseudovirgaria hyperparasitica TaxID=470096 RepID=A0A6A6W7Q9_9PEZI|nr:uncharacterized protein EJ05DRAFT_476274 [Pseudovirgaria hyperparasitica]KAF2757990.1 hypothetical protein EJ05DRAFT_476274 [Pseudovirgaria hyperparasitica]